jgi:hypothetical protein
MSDSQKEHVEFIAPVLPALEVTGKVVAVLSASKEQDLEADVREGAAFIAGEGVAGDRHSGALRGVGARESDLRYYGYPKSHRIANYRMFSAVAQEDLDGIATAMNLPGIPHGCLGENLVLQGIPNLTQLPAHTKLVFHDPLPEGSTEKPLATCVLVVCEENKPCIHPGNVIQSKYPEIEKLAGKFPKAAIGRRGVVGTVYVSGSIRPGQSVQVLVPKQRMYDPYGILQKQHDVRFNGAEE